MKSAVCDGDKNTVNEGLVFKPLDALGCGYGYRDGDGFGSGFGGGYGGRGGYRNGDGCGFRLIPKDTPDTTPLDLTITHSEDLRSDVVLTLTQQLRRYP